MTALVLRGDARRIPLRAESVDLVVTSLPFFGLRDYGGLPGEIGAEVHWRNWLDNVVAATAEMVRVTKPTGSLFVEVGDKRCNYQGSHYGQGRSLDGPRGPQRIPAGGPTNAPDRYGIPNKSLMLLPERYRIACVDQLGLTARQVIVWCLAGDTRLYARTATGDRPITLRDLHRSYHPENVQLWNGQKWTQVLGWNRTPRSGSALEIELRSGERIGCTRNHQWLTQRGLLKADELKIGDVIATTVLPEPDRPRRPSALDDELVGWFVGMYLAEGSRSGKVIQIASHIAEQERFARLRQVAEVFDGKCSVYRVGGKGTTVALSGAVLRGILDRYLVGDSAKTKRLRFTAWQRSNEFLRALLQGYLDGDGHYETKTDRWQLRFTANDELAADLRALAARLGASLRLRRRTTTCEGRSFAIWGGDFRWSKSDHWNIKHDGEIVAIRASRAWQFYDVGVADEPHLFALASGVLTHNSKSNAIPNSAADRTQDTHTTWVHFTMARNYYSAWDELREPHQPQSLARSGRNRFAIDHSQDGVGSPNTINPAQACHPLGRMPGSVWRIPTEQFPKLAHLEVEHHAAFGVEWPRRLILAGSPPGICLACGRGRFPVVDRRTDISARPNGYVRARATMDATDDGAGPNGSAFGAGPSVRGLTEATILGYACSCTPATWHPGTGERSPTARGDGRQGERPLSDLGARHHRVRGWWEYHLDRWAAPSTRPAVVLDPFGGTGTTAQVAHALGRIGISLDLAEAYCKLANDRTLAAQRAAKVQGRVNRERQLDLFGGVA
jgi:hypothetical protein